MLRKNVKDWIKHEKMLRESGAQISKKPRQRARYNRIRKSATKAIEDLTFLLEYLPEKQLTQMFNEEKMKPFFEELLNLKVENRKRILTLWRIILIDVARTSYVSKVVGRERWQLIMQLRETELQALRAIVSLEA